MKTIFETSDFSIACLEHIVNGNMAAARMVTNGVTAGDRMYINTHTGPTKTGFYKMKVTVKEVLQKGSFLTHESDPYFGYNLFNINDIIG